MIKLSIITINFNNLEGLRKTIESVSNQTFEDYEYIIIDGGSTDGSVEIINQYRDKISYWVSEPDKGIYNAMNKGIKVAQGEYCYFLNSGDTLFASNTLSNVFNKNINTDIIYGNILKYHNGFKEIDKGPATSEITFNHLYIGTINHLAAFQKRKLFKEYGLYNEEYKVISDWIFFLETLGFGNATISYIDVIIAEFDMFGISNNFDYYNKERRPFLENKLPKRILADYDSDYLSGTRKIHSYKLTWFLYRAIRKVVYKYEYYRNKFQNDFLKQ